uniref:Uncharacterized protein n=1 Tax=Onchocerca volvulus TaxID=6282 RepID=A0A8R1U255_ONCVO
MFSLTPFFHTASVRRAGATHHTDRISHNPSFKSIY